MTTEGEDLRDEGMQRALDRLPGAYRAEFIAQWNILTTFNIKFTSEDVTAVVGMPFVAGSPSNGCVGALTRMCAERGKSLGLLRQVGVRKAKRPISHAAMLIVYQGIP